MKTKKIQLPKLLELSVDKATNKVSNRESEHREFKLKFENNNLPKFCKDNGSLCESRWWCPFFWCKR